MNQHALSRPVTVLGHVEDVPWGEGLKFVGFSLVLHGVGLSVLHLEGRVAPRLPGAAVEAVHVGIGVVGAGMGRGKDLPIGVSSPSPILGTEPTVEGALGVFGPLEVRS